jgi:hypothetical protein
MVLINCNLKIVNALYDNNFYKLYYIPYSISTIKILIENKEDFNVDILLKPMNSQNNDDFCGGFDDDRTGLQIIWGGGQENGVHTIVKGNEKKYIFIFIFPTIKSKLSSYNLTLLVKKTLLDFKKKVIDETISIKLKPIEAETLRDNIAHQNIFKDSENIKITFDGTLIGSYYPRWYPELQNSFINNNYYYQSDPLISNISLKILKKSRGFNKDTIVIDFQQKEIAIIEGDMHGANYHIDIFKFNTSIIIRIWFLWISKKQFHDGINLDPLEMDAEKRRFFDSPELPDFERFDIVVSPEGNILAVCTDFHWQEYWYKLRRDNTNMIGMVAKLFHPIDESLARLCNRNFVSNNYESIIRNLQKILSPYKNTDISHGLLYIEGEEIEKAIQNRKSMEIERGKSFFRSHVPYVRNGDILSNMISNIVDNVD